MAVNATVVRALKTTYSRETLLEKLAEATAEMMDGVQVTQVTFEGGGASGRAISQDPGYVVEHVQAAIDLWDDPSAQSRPRSAFMDLGARRFGT